MGKEVSFCSLPETETAPDIFDTGAGISGKKLL